MNEGVQAAAAPRPVGHYPHARRVGDLLFWLGILAALSPLLVSRLRGRAALI